MIKNKLFYWIDKQKVSISEISKDTGLSRTTLTDLKFHRTARIDLRMLETLCQYFNITPGEFFEYKPKEK